MCNLISQSPSKFLFVIQGDTGVFEEFYNHAQLRFHRVCMLEMVKMYLKLQSVQLVSNLSLMVCIVLVPATIEFSPFCMWLSALKRWTSRFLYPWPIILKVPDKVFAVILLHKRDNWTMGSEWQSIQINNVNLRTC